MDVHIYRIEQISDAFFFQYFFLQNKQKVTFLGNR